MLTTRQRSSSNAGLWFDSASEEHFRKRSLVPGPWSLVLRAKQRPRTKDQGPRTNDQTIGDFAKNEDETFTDPCFPASRRSGRLCSSGGRNRHENKDSDC